MRAIARRTIHGALAGALGAACMTVLRMLAHRTGAIEQMVPQAVEAWAKHHAPIDLSASPSRRALHHIADQVLHVGFGASFGTLYGAALGGRRASLGKTVAFGVGVWVFGSFILLPSLKIVRPEWRANARELSINLAAHLAYAAAVALLVEEFEKQASLQPLAYPLSFHAHTG